MHRLIPLLAALVAGMLSPLQPAGAEEQRPADAAESAPGTPPQAPGVLFAAMARDVRPQWRQLYRSGIQRAPGDRCKAALGLGALVADISLAAEARDAQQVRNLLQDMEALEKLVGIAEQMTALHQKLVTAAEQNDWAAVRKETAPLRKTHRRLFTEHKDELLAEIEYLGEWLRTLHICAHFAARQPPPPGACARWHDLLAEMQRRAMPLPDKTESRSVRLLCRQIMVLERLWREPLTAENCAARLKDSRDVLDDTIARLVQDQVPPPVPP